MNKKTIKRVNGGITLYYGISSVIGAISAAIGTGTWLFKVFSDQVKFSWGTLAALVILTAFLGFMGYSILRVGYEEMEK